MLTEDVISPSVSQLFSDYRANPLRFLREAGLQAQLRLLIQHNLDKETCFVKIKSSRAGQVVRHAFIGHKIERAQVEVRIQIEGGKDLERSDIVILRRTPETDDAIVLTLYPMGHLDIVSKLGVADVDAVIELKVSCSADKTQRHAYRRDINRLWLLTKSALKDGHKLSTHFVLIDRSIGFNFYNCSAYEPFLEWHHAVPEDERWKSKAVNERWQDFLNIELAEEKPKDGIFVHVWMCIDGEHPILKYAMCFEPTKAMPLLNKTP